MRPLPRRDGGWDSSRSRSLRTRHRRSLGSEGRTSRVAQSSEGGDHPVPRDTASTRASRPRSETAFAISVRPRSGHARECRDPGDARVDGLPGKVAAARCGRFAPDLDAARAAPIGRVEAGVRSRLSERRRSQLPVTFRFAPPRAVVKGVRIVINGHRCIVSQRYVLASPGMWIRPSRLHTAGVGGSGPSSPTSAAGSPPTGRRRIGG